MFKRVLSWLFYKINKQSEEEKKMKDLKNVTEEWQLVYGKFTRRQ